MYYKLFTLYIYIYIYIYIYCSDFSSRKQKLIIKTTTPRSLNSLTILTKNTIEYGKLISVAKKKIYLNGNKYVFNPVQ